MSSDGGVSADDVISGIEMILDERRIRLLSIIMWALDSQIVPSWENILRVLTNSRTR